MVIDPGCVESVCQAFDSVNSVYLHQHVMLNVAAVLHGDARRFWLGLIEEDI